MEDPYSYNVFALETLFRLVLSGLSKLVTIKTMGMRNKFDIAENTKQFETMYIEYDFDSIVNRLQNETKQQTE